MQQFLETLTTNTALFVDLTISLLALSFMCALTYAMRWLPGKTPAYRVPPMDALVLKHNALVSKPDLSTRCESVEPRTVAAEKEAATIE
jgi:hypothetical protein